MLTEEHSSMSEHCFQVHSYPMSSQKSIAVCNGGGKHVALFWETLSSIPSTGKKKFGVFVLFYFKSLSSIDFLSCVISQMSDKKIKLLP